MDSWNYTFVFENGKTESVTAECREEAEEILTEKLGGLPPIKFVRRSAAY